MTPAALHPDARLVLDADAGRLALTHDEAEAVASEAVRLQDQADGDGSVAWWIAYVLHDIRHGARDRRGRRTW